MNAETPTVELLNLLEGMRGVRILVAGDIILDRYIWGRVDRISPEAPVPVVEETRSEMRLGGAANVAANLVAIGVEPVVCGFIGDDSEGREVITLLESSGISREGVLVDRVKPTTVKTRIIASAQQVVRIDREQRKVSPNTLSEGLAAVVDANLESCRGVVVSDYGKGTVSEPLLRKLDVAYKEGKIGFSALRPYLLDPHPDTFPLYRSAGVIKANKRETEAALGIKIQGLESAGAAAGELLKKWLAELVVITLGSEGLILVERESPESFIHLPTRARDVFDVSGAGDTVAAVLCAGLAAGGSAVSACELANMAAGLVVGEIGTRPAEHSKLLKEIESSSMEEK